MSAIEVIDLAKTYAYHRKAPGLRGSLISMLRRQTLERRAVDGISFTLDQGECVGFLGPNGAGKTTTLKLLCGLLSPRRAVFGCSRTRRHVARLRSCAVSRS